MNEPARIDVERLLQQQEETSPAERAGEIAALLPRGVMFATPVTVSGEPARPPDEEWALTSAWPYRDETATGTAAVYYGAGHTRLTRPMIFADGFSYGPSDLAGLWTHLNTPYSPSGERLLDQLLAAGVDVVLLGFDVRHTYIQANAGVAVSCVRQAITRRQGSAPLIVGGVSMGGVVTRYALAAMEDAGEDHQTATYLSYDSPHNGAWIPLILQQLAYFSERLSPPEPGTPGQAGLIKSPAAQQLLWGWVEKTGYSGPVATASPLRQEFLADLEKLGWFPSEPRKLGVVNGTGDGTGLGVTPGEQVFEWSRLGGLVGATVRIQPAYGDRQHVGGMRAVPLWASKSYTTRVAPFDGAPGGTLASYGMLAEKLGVEIDDRHREVCFVPSVSAAALKYDPVGWPVDLHTDLSTLPGGSSHLNDFRCDVTNSAHGTVTRTLAEWILAQLTG
ncbi:hypothetical protein GCM10017673_08500 [Streptosporangium violaceochromogenes]|nr:hypothetical protein GCM10017673_08500 [Streptosporangium violaceochromogenes]